MLPKSRPGDFRNGGRPCHAELQAFPNDEANLVPLEGVGVDVARLDAYAFADEADRGFLEVCDGGRAGGDVRGSQYRDVPEAAVAAPYTSGHG